jgi:hypothetical protein
MRTGFRKFTRKKLCIARERLGRARLTVYPPMIKMGDVAATIVHDHRWGILVTRKSLTWGHVAFDTSRLFWKIAVRLDSPYLQQRASIRKMPTNAIACRTSIRRFKRANYQLIDQLNFVENRIFWGGKVYTRSRISVLKLYTNNVNLYTHIVKLYTHRSTGT